MGEGMEMEQDKTGRSKMLRLLFLFLIPGIIIQKTWKSRKNAEGILELFGRFFQKIICELCIHSAPRLRTDSSTV